MLRFRVLGALFSRFGCFVFEIWVLRFRVLGALFSRFGCFVLRSSFSRALFSTLPYTTAKNRKTIKFAYWSDTATSVLCKNKTLWERVFGSGRTMRMIL